MPNLIGQFLKDAAEGFFGNDYLRDYTHASKTFRSNFYQNTPKFKFLFHVYFDINTDVIGRQQPVTSLPRSNFGLLVKTVRLPGYTFQTHDMNQYNRKRIVQSKIKYDPIDITFHDDNDNLINSLWYRYYTYYYKDATKPSVVFAGKRGGLPSFQTPGGGGVQTRANASTYYARNLYADEIPNDDNWGYIGENSLPTNTTGVKNPFFNNVTIFGLNRHNFIAYTLINPMITRFGHDTYDYDQGNGIMQNSMTLEYETVVYNQGKIDGKEPDNIVTGFGENATYDRKLSPINQPGSNSNVLGPGGIVESAGGSISQLLGGDVIGGIRSAGRAYNAFKNTNLKVSLQEQLKQTLGNALNDSGGDTRQKLFDIPVYPASPSNTGVANSPPVARAQPSLLSPNNFAGLQNNVNGSLISDPTRNIA